MSQLASELSSHLRQSYTTSDAYTMKLELIYQPSVNLENIEEVFKSKKNTDIISKQTNYGIHRDELVFNINEKNAMRFASQGQIRNIILTVKLTLCEVIYEYKNKYPILLLDDVLSELDINRQNNLLNLLDSFGQTFISTVDTSSLNKEILKKYQIITL